MTYNSFNIEMENYNKIITELQEKYDGLKEEFDVIDRRAERMRNELNSLDLAIRNLRKIEASENESEEIPINENDRFSDIVIYILKEEQCPLTSRQLQHRYNNLFPRNEKSRSTFSGMISHIFDQGSSINRIEIPEIKGRSKFVYGLPDWFSEAGNLKQEYHEALERKIEAQK